MQQENTRGEKKKFSWPTAGLSGWKRELWEWIKILLTAALVAFVINSFILANSTVPTGSMENTIMSHSRVFGSRLHYTFGEVHRGDVAVFLYGYTCAENGQTYRETVDGKCPNCGTSNAKNKKVYYVKRVIGLPGDHIQIKKTGEADVSAFHKINIGSASGEVPVGTVYVNGEPLTESYLPEPMIVDGDTFPEVDVVVPEGSYFVLGDNRNNSRDARYWTENQFVRKDRMVARVFVKYWPLNEMGLIK